MNAQPLRPTQPFDLDYARERLASLKFQGACAKAATCWLAGASPDGLPTFASFKSAGGDALSDSFVVFEFDRKDIRIVQVGADFLRVLGDIPIPTNFREFGSRGSYAERRRKANLAASGSAIKNLRQLHLADGQQVTVEEVILPLADRGPTDGATILYLADFGSEPLSARPRVTDFDEPAFSESVELFRREEI